MHQVDFSNAEAKYCQFLQCDLLNAIFDNTNIEHSDLSSAYNFEIDPSLNKIKSAIFSKDNLIGLLKPFHIKVK